MKTLRTLKNNARQVNSVAEVLEIARMIQVSEDVRQRIEHTDKSFKSSFMPIGKRVYTIFLPEETRQITREVLVIKDASVVMAVTTNANILFPIQPRIGKRIGSIELPAGYLEPGETPSQAAARELEEETGNKCEALVHLCTYQQDQGKSVSNNHAYLALGCTATGKKNLDPDEILIDIECPFGVVMQLLKEGYISDANSRLAILESKERVLAHLSKF